MTHQIFILLKHALQFGIFNMQLPHGRQDNQKVQEYTIKNTCGSFTNFSLNLCIHNYYVY